MRSLLLVMTCSTLLLRLAAPAPVLAADGALPERLSAEVDRFSGGFDGVVLVARGDEILLERACGVRDSRTGAPTTPDTLFRIGSITKQLTAATVLALAQEGRVALDAPLSRYLPEYPRKHLVREGVEVTLEHLLRHTSGVVRAEKLPGVRARTWNAPIDARLFLDEVMRHPLSDVPGRTWRYSNTGYMLLGEVVRRVTGTTFEAALRERLLSPLGMRDTGIVPSPEQRARMARGRYPLAGWWVDSTEAFRLHEPNLNDVRTSGAAFSTARDLLRWSQQLLQPDRGPLTPESVAAMTTPGLEDYGYGVVITGEGERRRIWHNGAISPLGFSSELAVFPEQRWVVVVLSNDDHSRGAAARLRRNLVALLQGEPPAEPAQPAFRDRAKAAAIGAVFLFSRGDARLLVPVCLLAWWLAAALRKPRATRLEWIEATAAPAGLLSLSLALVFEGSARELWMWAGSAAFGAVGAALALRTRPAAWAGEGGASRRANKLAAAVLPVLVVAGVLGGSAGVARMLLAWGLTGVGLAWPSGSASARDVSPAG
jgi:CubicO group peptidase (beta-lactamase class C family)